MKDPQRLGPVLGGYYCVARGSEDFTCNLSYEGFVFHKQNRFRPAPQAGYSQRAVNEGVQRGRKRPG